MKINRKLAEEKRPELFKGKTEEEKEKQIEWLQRLVDIGLEKRGRVLPSLREIVVEE